MNCEFCYLYGLGFGLEPLNYSSYHPKTQKIEEKKLSTIY